MSEVMLSIVSNLESIRNDILYLAGLSTVLAIVVWKYTSTSTIKKSV